MGLERSVWKKRNVILKYLKVSDFDAIKTTESGHFLINKIVIERNFRWINKIMNWFFCHSKTKMLVLFTQLTLKETNYCSLQQNYSWIENFHFAQHILLTPKIRSYSLRNILHALLYQKCNFDLYVCRENVNSGKPECLIGGADIYKVRRKEEGRLKLVEVANG